MDNLNLKPNAIVICTEDVVDQGVHLFTKDRLYEVAFDEELSEDGDVCLLSDLGGIWFIHGTDIDDDYLSHFRLATQKDKFKTLMREFGIDFKESGNNIQVTDDLPDYNCYFNFTDSGNFNEVSLTVGSQV